MKKVLLTVLGFINVLGLAAQWNVQEDHRLTGDNVLNFEAQTNKNGITFVAFWKLVAEDPAKQGNRYSEGSDIAYYLQIVDKEGNNLFSNNGQLISHEPSRSFTTGDDDAVFTDSEGNALLIVKDERNWNSASYPNQSYFVYKVSPTGDLLWEKPLDLDRGTAYYAVNNIKGIEVEDGSYIFAHDIRHDEGIAYIAIDKVSKNGEFIWEEPLLLSSRTVSYVCPFLADAGYGDFIVVYSKSPGHQMYAQKFDFEKGKGWPDEAPIYRRGFTSGHFPWTSFNVIPDTKGGVFAAWFDDRYSTDVEKAHVSHILANGEQGFITSGDDEGLRLNWSGQRGYEPSMCYDPVGEILYVVWEERNGSQAFRSLVLQKVSKEGELFWTNPEGAEGNTNGLILDSGWSPSIPGYYSIQLAGEGKIAVFYQHNYTASNTSTENVAILLDVTGEQPQYVWPEEKLVYSPKNQGKAGLRSLPLIDNEYFLTFWNDYRTASSGSMGSAAFAQKVHLSAQTAIRFPETGAGNPLEVVSNGKNGKVDFVIESPEAGNATLEVYSVAGQKVARIQSQLLVGKNTIPGNLQHLSTGVYVVRLATQNGVYAKRFYN
ncbi:MAG: T9SS type A sorting domain-containing protein [Dysgonamonadaceae bacterium]|jgi:hypothetical protein|nr:T9SS type A sorting domain-containing protein [Dysgonamonadaceae bacterium]